MLCPAGGKASLARPGRSDRYRPWSVAAARTAAVAVTPCHMIARRGGVISVLSRMRVTEWAEADLAETRRTSRLVDRTTVVVTKPTAPLFATLLVYKQPFFFGEHGWNFSGSSQIIGVIEEVVTRDVPSSASHWSSEG